MKNGKNIFLFLIASLAFISCGDRPFFEENKEITDNSWSWDEPVSFNVNIEDTLNAYNFFINLRITKSYEYSNIYMFVNLAFPDGRSSRDTVPCVLADDYGNWIGKSSGSLIDNKILFAMKRVFPVAGTYTFKIEQGMRNKELTEVTDVGLRIEKSKR
jgi:gliding motility-associated lipoprotein GldH